MTERPEEVIEHGQVTLRRYRPDDLEAVFRAVTESLDHLRPWMAWTADYSEQSAAEFLAASALHWEDGSEYNYAIIAGDVLAGGAGLMARIGPGGWRSATGCTRRTPAAAWPRRRRRRWCSRR